MRNKLFWAILPLAAALMLVSCDKEAADRSEKQEQAGVKPAKSMGLNVLPVTETFETKAGENPAGKLTNVFGSEEDGLVIEEYVSDFDFTAPVTKGTEIKTTNIGTKYGKFQVFGISDFTEKGVRHQELHFNEMSQYSSGQWDWEGESPVWRVNTKETIWSVAPAIVGSDSLVTVSDIDPTSPSSFSFNYSVPYDYADQQDILFAYNVEEREWEQVNPYDTYEWTWKETTPKQDSTFNVKFYHALAAVKFELADGMNGVDVHSITLCYTQTDANENVSILSGGLATSGDCLVQGSGTGTGSVSFTWTNTGGNKPLYYEYGNGQSVAGKYASTGEGVLFMIPQQASNVSVIVEFSKYGSTTYTTRLTKIPSVNWQAGKYYTYKLSGDIHVVGELLSGKVDLSATKFKDNPASNLWSTNFGQKGINKVAVIVDGYTWEGNQSGELWLFVSNGTTLSETHPSSSPFTYNLLDTDVPNTPSTNTIYHFGLNNPASENYDSYYTYDTSTSKTATRHFVFDVEGVSPFNIQQATTSGNNGAKFTAHVRCMLILEVKNVKLPANWKNLVNS